MIYEKSNYFHYVKFAYKCCYQWWINKGKEKDILLLISITNAEKIGERFVNNLIELLNNEL